MFLITEKPLQLNHLFKKLPKKEIFIKIANLSLDFTIGHCRPNSS